MDYTISLGTDFLGKAACHSVANDNLRQMCEKTVTRAAEGCLAAQLVPFPADPVTKCIVGMHVGASIGSKHGLAQMGVDEALPDKHGVGNQVASAGLTLAFDPANATQNAIQLALSPTAIGPEDTSYATSSDRSGLGGTGLFGVSAGDASLIDQGVATMSSDGGLMSIEPASRGVIF